VYAVVLHAMTSCSFIPDRAACTGSALLMRVGLGKRGGKKRLSISGIFLATAEELGTKDPA